MSKLLIDEEPLQVLPTLAKAIGLNEALFLQQLHYWLKRSKNEHDGRVWVYNTFEQWQTQFPFWSLRTMQRIAKSLVSQELLVVRQFRKTDRDQTNWYSINYDQLPRQSGVMDSDKLASSSTPECRLLDDDKMASSYKDQETTQENTNNAHSRLFGIHFKRLGGKVMDSAAQGKAIKTLLANYTEAECARCYESQLTEDWRKRKVSWLTVLKDIGSWLDNKAHPTTPAKVRIYEWQGKMYAEDEIVSDDGERYTVMGRDGTPTKRWRTPEAFAHDTGRDVEKVRAGWN